MKITFWGVRGSIAVSGAEYARTGGNTTCIEVQHAGEGIGRNTLLRKLRGG
ncbi:MAG: phosphoribosyl 1,2-cyclic phosphodiesterase [Myxococcota bacterium]|jgi:phosphoribosyl 1,2-cyclic phosphodiesterase